MQRTETAGVGALRRGARVAGWLALAAAVVDWAGLRQGWWSHAPGVLLGLAALAGALLALRGAGLAWGWRRASRPLAGAAELATIAGLLVMLAAGGANWVLGYSGFVVLQEGMTVRLDDGVHLEGFHGGLLPRTSELAVSVTLADVELVPAQGGGFEPRSRVLVTRPGGEPVAVDVSRRALGRAGSLRLHQGSFGFAPRIVLMQGARTVFDRVVPFTTALAEAGIVRFEGHFTVESEDLEVDGVLDLSSLDEDFKGHATLSLDVRHHGRSLGRGRLLPGHFAEMAEGWRAGFAGLERWSEIDVSRRNYSRAVLGGAGLALAGLVAWPLAAWRGR